MVTVRQQESSKSAKTYIYQIFFKSSKLLLFFSQRVAFDKHFILVTSRTSLSMKPDSAEQLLSDICVVLRSASAKCSITEEKFPSEFYEPNPGEIYESYFQFMKERTEENGDLKGDSGEIKLTTISQRMDDGYYSVNHNGFYKLYHDVKLVCTLLIHYYQPGTRNYQLVDKFYRFATELIIRECYNIGSSLQTDVDGHNANDSSSTNPNSELYDSISQDFIKITTSYKVPIPQTYHIRTRDLDLFSSIIAKSSLDRRAQELPNSNFEINKVIPQTDILEEAPKLGFVCANTSNIPDPTLPPTEMLTRFLHPNWYALPTTTWLKYGGFESWAPSFNEGGSVLDSTSRGMIWLRRIGYMKFMDGKEQKKRESGTEDGNRVDDKATDSTMVPKMDTEGDKTAGEPKVEPKVDENKEDKPNDREDAVNEQKYGKEENDSGHVTEEHNRTQHEIQMKNLLKWAPENYIESDEIESFKAGLEANLINATLLKIRRLRNKRIGKDPTAPPGEEEVKLYYKVKRMIREVVLNRKIDKVPLFHQRMIPVLQANYSGGIPVVRTHVAKKRKQKK